MPSNPTPSTLPPLHLGCLHSLLEAGEITPGPRHLNTTWQSHGADTESEVPFVPILATIPSLAPRESRLLDAILSVQSHLLPQVFFLFYELLSTPIRVRCTYWKGGSFFPLSPSWVHFFRGQRDERISAMCSQEGDVVSLSLSFPHLGTQGTICNAPQDFPPLPLHGEGSHCGNAQEGVWPCAH